MHDSSAGKQRWPNNIRKLSIRCQPNYLQRLIMFSSEFDFLVVVAKSFKITCLTALKGVLKQVFQIYVWCKKYRNGP